MKLILLLVLIISSLVFLTACAIEPVVPVVNNVSVEGMPTTVAPYATDTFTVNYQSDSSSSGASRFTNITYEVLDGKIISCTGGYVVSSYDTSKMKDYTTTRDCLVADLERGNFPLVAIELPTHVAKGQLLTVDSYGRFWHKYTITI